VDAHQLAPLLGRQQRADLEQRREAVLVERRLGGADAVGEPHHRVVLGRVFREERPHLLAERVELGLEALVLGTRGVCGGADLRERRSVEPEPLGVALEDRVERRLLAMVTALARERGCGEAREREQHGEPAKPLPGAHQALRAHSSRLAMVR
jgi:hypothetical protein